MRTVKQMVENGQKAVFTHYRDGALWYQTECGFAFPVPLVRDPTPGDFGGDAQVAALAAKAGAKVDDGIGTAVFHAQERALLLMRYIRKQVALVEQATVEEAPNAG